MKTGVRKSFAKLVRETAELESGGENLEQKIALLRQELEHWERQHTIMRDTIQDNRNGWNYDRYMWELEQIMKVADKKRDVKDEIEYLEQQLQQKD